MLRQLRMFKSSSSHFSSITCPKLKSCKLPHCVFSHQKRPLATEVDSTTTEPSPKKQSLTPASPAIQPPSPSPKSAVERIIGLQDDTDDISFASPRGLPGVGAPASLQQRMKYITLLEQNYTKTGSKAPKKDAVDAEYRIASTTTNLAYNVTMKQLIRDSKNGVHYTKPDKSTTTKISDQEMYMAVHKLIHSKERLEREGYTVDMPSIDPSVDLNSKKCDRCGESFYLSTIMAPTSCRFHERKKRFENNDRYWECCSQVVGESQGCKSSKHHVFKAKTAMELHHLIPFESTPSSSEAKQRIIGLDCEMGYTSKGMEMIRLTIVDFYTGKTLFDEIVKPSGHVLDLNTNWSGVSEIPDQAMTLKETMNVVLNNLIDEQTIIVGHGLENDLNTMRLVHHNVVDTAVLFPKSMTKKYALKDLAFQFLDRKIQTGEHSSEEDSLAAIDIIKVKIANQ